MSGRKAPEGKLSPLEVAREALAAYRSYFGVLLVTALIVFIPAGLVETAAHELEGLDPDEVGGVAVVALIGSAAVITLTATMGDVFYTGIVVAIVDERRTGSRRELAEIARRLPYLRLAAVDVLFGLMVAAGIVLLIVPGIVAFTWFALAAPLVEIEGLGVRGAFRRSRALVHGSFWRVLLILAPVLVVGDALATLLGSIGPGFLGDGFLGDWAGAVLAEAITAPFFALAAIVTAHHLISGRPAPRTPPR